MIAIESKEGCCIIARDTKGAFISAQEKDFTVVKFLHKQVDILCSVNDKHMKYVSTEGKNKVLHSILLKALFRTLAAAIL